MLTHAYEMAPYFNFTNKIRNLKHRIKQWSLQHGQTEQIETHSYPSNPWASSIPETHLHPMQTCIESILTSSVLCNGRPFTIAFLCRERRRTVDEEATLSCNRSLSVGILCGGQSRFVSILALPLTRRQHRRDLIPGSQPFLRRKKELQRCPQNWRQWRRADAKDLNTKETVGRSWKKEKKKKRVFSIAMVTAWENVFARRHCWNARARENCELPGDFGQGSVLSFPFLLGNDRWKPALVFPRQLDLSRSSAMELGCEFCGQADPTQSCNDCSLNLCDACSSQVHAKVRLG